VEFPLGDAIHKIGIATDIGHVESDLIDALYGVDECIIESNHDVSMLMTGPYPYMLKRRILSPQGHLSNDDCSKLMSILAQSGIHAFMLAHLSKENNYPPTAELTAKTALAAYPNIRIAVAAPNKPTEIYI
jgi:phosphoribosyl 1,2-cyclic phosphodiesterase